MDFESSRSKESLVDHVHSVSHTDNQNVVQLVHPVHLIISTALTTGQFRKTHLGEKLIDYRVSDTGTTSRRSSLFTDSIQLVKDDNV
jgi:hypothetical protein